MFLHPPKNKQNPYFTELIKNANNVGDAVQGNGYIGWEIPVCTNFLEDILMIYIRSTKHFLPFDLEIPLLGIHSGEINTLAKICVQGCSYKHPF